MNRNETNRSRPRRRGPTVEGLESRELLSLASVRMRSIRAAYVQRISGSLDVPPPLEAAKLAGQTQTPTPHEVAKSSMGLTVTGSYLVGPPRFEGQQSQTAIYLTSGAVMNGLHKVVAMQVITPASGPVQVTAVLQTPRRSGPPSNAVLNLSPLTSDQSRVLPTQMAWTLNGDMSTGIFKNGSGEGVVYLEYSNTPGSGKFLPGTMQRGLATAHFSGLIHTNALIQNLIRGQPAGD